MSAKFCTHLTVTVSANGCPLGTGDKLEIITLEFPNVDDRDAESEAPGFLEDLVQAVENYRLSGFALQQWAELAYPHLDGGAYEALVSLFGIVRDGEGVAE